MAGFGIGAYGAYNSAYGNIFSPGSVRSRANALYNSGQVKAPGKDGSSPSDIWGGAAVRQVSALVSGMKEMSAAAIPLKSGGAVWRGGEAVSSDEDVFTARMDGPRTMLSYRVTVDQTAAAQRSVSSDLRSDETGGVRAGQNVFSVTAEGRTYEFSVDIGGEDTNAQALGKVAAGLNGVGSGVRASVVAEGDVSRLVVTGRTGRDSAFAVKSDGAELDLTDVETARDAVYSMYGQRYSSSGNTVDIAGGRIELQLKGAGTATVTSRQDVAGVVGAVEAFVQSFNASANDLAALPATPQTRQLQMRMSPSSYSRGQLASIGVTVNTDRTARVDSERLTRALQEDPSRVKNQISQMASQADTAFRGAQALRFAPQSGSYLLNYLQSGGFSGLGGGLVLDLFT